MAIAGVVAALGGCAPAGRSVEPEPARAIRPAPVDEPGPSTEPVPEPEPSTAARSPAGPPELVALPVPGFLDAVLALPAGEQRLKLALAAHGAGDDPEGTCQAWSKRLGDGRAVLCPRGRAISKLEPRGHYYPDHLALEREVMAALAALEERLGPRLAPDDALYAGYSQGATMGALFVPEHGDRFPSLILTEGGYREWSLRSARTFAKTGGRRVLFVCGVAGCAKHARRSRTLLERVGVEARVEAVTGAGHTEWGRVAKRLDQAFEWALGGAD